MTKITKTKSLRKSTLTIFALFFILLIFSVYFLLNTIMMDSIDQLEEKNVSENIERALNTMEQQESALASVTRDWAGWDDTYTFVEDGNEAYLENNIYEDVFVNLNLNLMAIINESGEYTFATGMDLENTEFVPVYPELKNALEKGGILHNTDSGYAVKGIIMLPEGPMLIASHPILKNDLSGPTRGNLVFGRFLDATAVSELSEILNLDVSLEIIEPENHENAQKTSQPTQKPPIEIKMLGKDKLEARTKLNDINGNPALALRIELLREVSMMGKKGVYYTLYSLIAAGLSFTLIIWLFLEKTILSRLLALSREVINIGDKGLFRARLGSQKRPDEISSLSEEINRMLDRLEESEHRISESEQKYRTLVEKGTEIVYSLNREGAFSYISPNCTEVLGYSAEEILGKTFTAFVHPDDKAKWSCIFQNMSVFDQYKEGCEYRARIKEGSWKWFETKVSSVPECRNEQRSYIGIFYDIHKRKIAEEALQHAHDSLETKVRERTVELSESNKLLQAEIEERKKIQEKVTHLAYHDHLTGLPNKIMFTDRLSQAIFLARRTEKPLGVLFVDLDAFKMVNDTMGHDQGDELLKEVAKRLAASVRSDDTVCRVGGDEFILMVQNISNPEDIVKIANKVVACFEEPYKLKGQDFFVTSSIGVAMYPIDGDNVDTLIKNADIAMYKAKESGKNQYVMCTPVMKDKVMETMTLTNRLYRALERNELMLYYQPQVSCESSKIIGVEALLRWKHPELGFVPPSKFIPLAEQTGLIMSIGDWVLKTACKQNKAWRDAGFPHMRMAVNLSLQQLQNPNIGRRVDEILEETGLSPRCLELEITESIAMNESGQVIEVLESFKKKGISISIDDFGTEYSSLSRLKYLPIDRIKIAMPFVQGIAVSEKDEAITKAIIVLAKNLGMHTIAEGVETKQQLDFLSQRMCEEIQGFYYYKPLPAEEIEAILRADGILKLEDGE